MSVFGAAACALVVPTARNVAVGVLGHCVSVRHMQVAAGIGCIVIGAWTLLHR